MNVRRVHEKEEEHRAITMRTGIAAKMPARKRGVVMSLALAAALGIAQQSQAAPLYWDGGGSPSTLWTTVNNWDTASDGSGGNPVAAPGASDVATFNVSTLNAATIATLNGPLSVQGMVFNNTGTTAINTDGVANRVITLGTGGLTLNTTAGAVTFGTVNANERFTFILNGSQSWTNDSVHTLLLVNHSSGGGGVDLGPHTLTVAGSGNITTGSRAIIGAGSIIKNGTGTLSLGLSGGTAMTFTGGVTLNSGTLILGKDTALGGVGSAALTINGGTIDVSGARLTVNNNAQNWNGDFAFSGANTWDTGTGAVTMNASRQVTVNASTMTVGGAIGDSGSGYGLTKEGGGTLVLNGANTYAGTTIVNGGTLALGNVNAVQSSTLDTGTSGAQAVTFTVAGANTYNLGGLQGADALAIGSNTISVGNNNASTTFSGAISGTGGSLSKVGSGTLTLSSASNTYSGATTVSNGTLRINGNQSGATGTVTVTGGTLGGTGTVGGAVAIADSATSLLYPNNAFAGGTLTCASNVTFAGSSAVAKFDLSGSAGSGNDKVVLQNQTLTCGGATVTINSMGTLAAADYTLFDVGAGTISGSFAATPVWTGTAPANSNSYSIALDGTTKKVLLKYASGAAPAAGSDVAVTPVNTPVTINVTTNDTDFVPPICQVLSNLMWAGSTVDISGGTNLLYTPAAGSNGVDSFQYVITNAIGSATGTVTVTVNIPPLTAGNDGAATIAGSPVTINVTTNDTNFLAPIASVLSNLLWSGSTVSISSGTNLLYTPAAGSNGVDQFQYVITNAFGNSATGLVSVSVAPPPPPTAGNDSARTPTNYPVTINVTTNDTNFVAPIASVLSNLLWSGSTVSIASGTNLLYTPAAGSNGVDQFQYVITNAVGSATGMVAVTVVALLNVYVVPSGSTPTPPYDTWSIAATNIQMAVDFASANFPAYDTVVISNGTYNVTNQIEVTNALTVRSFEGGLAGAEKTIVQRSTVGGTPNTRVFYMTHAQAVLEGLTIRNGFAQSSGTFPADRCGSGVWMSEGSVRNCVIRDQVVNGNNWRGSGIYITGGTVSNCVVRNNSTGGSSGAWGAGLYVSGPNALVTHSVIARNSALGANDGGGVYLDGGAKLRNSLVWTNTAGRNGGGVYLTGSNTLAESCTIVGNAATNGVGGGVYRAGGSVSNSIVYFNTAPTDPNYAGTNTAIAYSCTTPLVANTGNISDDPLFVNAATNDFRLQKASPCLEAGLPPPSEGAPYTDGIAWVNGSVDLAGAPRYRNRAVDIGAYETYVPAGSVFTIR